MVLLKKILGSSILLLIANSFGRLAMFIANIVAARLLSQEIFGQFMMLRNTISLIENIVSGAFGNSTIKNIAQVQDKQKKLCEEVISIFFVYLLIAVMLALFITLYSSEMSKLFFLSSELLTKALSVGALLLVFSIMSIMSQNILIGLESYKLLTKISVSISTLMIPIILFSIDKYHFFGAIYSILFYFIIDFAIKIYFVTKKIDLKECAFSFQVFKQKSLNFISFSSPLLVSIILTSASFWYARVLLINSIGEFKDIAIFDAAFQWLTIIMIITGATTSVALPMLSKVSENFGSKESKDIFYINLGINFVITLVIALIFIFFSKNIMSIYGENYIQGYKILQILAITSIFFSVSSIFNKFMIAHNKVMIVLISTIISIVIMYILLLTVHLSVYMLSIVFLVFYFSLSLCYILFYRMLS